MKDGGSSKWVMIRMPISVRRSVRTGNYHDIPIRVPYPEFPVVGSTIAVRRIPMPFQNYVDVHLGGASQDLVEIVDLEPQQNPIAIRFVVPIGYWTVVMFYLEAV